MRIILCLLLTAAPLAADEVVLTNGRTLEGIVTVDGDRVTVQVPGGSVTIERSQVREIRKDAALLGEYDEKVRAAGTTPDLLFDAAVWSRQNGMAERSHALLERVVLIDPDHERARRLLGYERVEGRWLRGDDLMTARGFVLHRGRWMREDAYRSLLEIENRHLAAREQAQVVRDLAALRHEEEQSRINLRGVLVETVRESALLGNTPLRTPSPWVWPFWLPSPAPDSERAPLEAR